MALALGACGGEHGSQRAPAQPAGSAGAPSAAAPGPLHQVFDSVRESVAPGVSRISLSMMLAPGSGREAQRAAMQAVLDAERGRDSSLGAIRVLGFLPPPAADSGAHPSGMRMVPFAIVTWAPEGGWNALNAATARGPHSTQDLFVTDLPSHRRVPGAGGGPGR